MSILVPTQIDNAAFHIGTDQFFDLPISRLSKLSESAPAIEPLTPLELAPGTELPALSESAPVVASHLLSESALAAEPSTLSNVASAAEPRAAESPVHSNSSRSPNYAVRTRSEAIALLERVQRFFRSAEPSSPVPMLCERARALADRDFMGVLKDVLPKAALRNAGAEQ